MPISVVFFLTTTKIYTSRHAVALNNYKYSAHYTQGMCVDCTLVGLAGHSGCMLNYQQVYQGSWRTFWDAHCYVVRAAGYPGIVLSTLKNEDSV